MRNAHNDNEELPFRSLAQITARLLQSPREKQDGPGDTAEQRSEEQRAEQQRRYVDQRLRELAAFEDRASGRERR